MILGWPFPKRKMLLEELKSATTQDNIRISFQGSIQRFWVYRVPVGMPKYRLSNGRTQASQEAYISKHDEDADFFERDLESNKVHEIQHAILKELLLNKGKNLGQYFKDQDQNEPLILDSNGFVVNGNRRLCAFRELLKQNPQKYERFNYIEVVILPPCDEKDIDELEAQLQIIEDVKADYDWISQACMLRSKQKRHNYSYDDLSRIYQMSLKEINKELDILSHVDSYLESRNKPKEYPVVVNYRYAFEKIRESRKKINDETKKEIFTTLAYSMIDSPDESTGRLYEFIPNIQEYLDSIIEKILEEIPVGNEKEKDDDEDLLFLFDDEDELEDLPVIISKPENQANIYEILRDVVEAEKVRKRESNSKKATLYKVQKANTMLKEALLNYDAKKSVSEGITEQLEQIGETVNKLRETIKNG
ncbi:MAG TPA: hypothetical protein GXX18_02585 [Bacillales bacterium]|nr:hypothetical protein [Bacillales bacterium]